MPGGVVFPQSHDSSTADTDQSAHPVMPGAYDGHDNKLLVNLTVGIPPQQITARISFSSADTVIFSGPSTGFDPGRSTSFVQGLRDGRVGVDGHSFLGNVSRDDMEVEGARVMGAPFVNSGAESSEHGAYLGLGYKSFLGPDRRSFAHLLTGRWTKPYYGLYLPPTSYYSSIEESWRRKALSEGSVSFGKPDPRYAKAPVQWLESDSRPDGSWSVPFDGVSIDGKIVPMETYPHATRPNASSESTSFRTTSIRSGPATDIVVSQTSRKYILPDAMVDGLMQEVDGAVKWVYLGPSTNNTIWEVPCKLGNKVVLRLGSHDYELRPDDWTFASRNRCFSEFAYLSESSEGKAHLGTRFLEAFYTLWNLNPPEIGLMRLHAELPSPSAASIENLGSEYEAAASIDELRLSGPFPPLQGAVAHHPSSKGYAVHSYALVLFGACLSIYCLFRLWRRRGIALSPRSPLSPRLAKYALLNNKLTV